MESYENLGVSTLVEGGGRGNFGIKWRGGGGDLQLPCSRVTCGLLYDLELGVCGLCIFE